MSSERHQRVENIVFVVGGVYLTCDGRNAVVTSVCETLTYGYIVRAGKPHLNTRWYTKSGNAYGTGARLPGRDIAKRLS